MIITLKQNAAAEEVSRLRGELEAQGFVIHPAFKSHTKKQTANSIQMIL